MVVVERECWEDAGRPVFRSDNYDLERRRSTGNQLTSVTLTVPHDT